MNIKSMGLAWITSSDLKQSKEFFNNILGLTIAQDSIAEHGWMELCAQDNAFRLGVGKEAPEFPVKAGDNAVVTFTVADIVAAKAHLQKNNIALLGDIIEVPGHVKMLMFTDSDKNIWGCHI